KRKRPTALTQRRLSQELCPDWPISLVPQLRPTAEFLERLSCVEGAIAEVQARLQENEALDERTRQTLEHVAHELHGSGERFDALAKQIQSSMAVAFGRSPSAC
ncbi:MAG: hypothetical protein HC857_15560, partial [Synechococcales cyanobacterium RU_4_20]|nr:hypothetical protein [Synechococcales cyanobacterium RU_4_20]